MTVSKRNAFNTLAALAVFWSAPAKADVPAPPTPPPVPAGYCTTIYNELNGDLQTFNTQLETPPTWTPVPGGPTLYAANLSLADSNTGPQISGANYLPSVLNQLQELKALGIQAVTVPVGFPVLDVAFYGNSQTALAPYVTFYTNVATAVKNAGLKLIVDNEELFSNDIAAGWTNMNTFYASLTWTQYMAQRAQMAADIVKYMKPDYLILANEPDTEATQTGQQNLNNPVDAALMITGEITSVQAEVLLLGLSPAPKLGAGFGTWLPPSGLSSLLAYITAYIALPLDYIDMHLIPVNNETGNNFIGNTLTIASAAAAVGKPVAIGQAWLSKSLASEWNTIGDDVIRARAPFSFWAPIDSYFLQTLQSLANYTQMAYVAPGLNYFFAYQTYGGTTANGGAANCTCTTASCSDYQIMQTESTLTDAAQLAPAYTTTAFSYYSQLVTTPDATPPSEPTALTGTAGIVGANISWTASTDNVGIAGYNVYRCTPPGAGQPCTGVLIANVTEPSFVDSSLTSGTLYNYQVQAFDLVNNLSPLSTALNLQTIRTSASSATGLVATAISPKEIDLSWTAPANPSGLNKYLVYSGTSATSLVQIALTPSTTTTYKNMSLAPGTIYYYGIIAVEGGINAPMSPFATATTLPLPNPPSNVTGTPTPTTIALTWQENLQPGGLPVGSYQIFEGSAPGKLAKIGTSTTNSYTARSLSGSTPYYFEVVAVDTSFDDSAPSDQITVTTSPLPAAPVNVAASATAATKITVTWSETVPPGGLPIKYYYVYGGTLPNPTTKVGTVAAPATTYTNTGLSAKTTYYYTVEAVDTSLNVSPMSAMAFATTAPLPAAPINVGAATNADTRITVSWTETIPTGGLPILNYSIWRGTTPTGLAPLTGGVRTASPFIDTGAAPNTTYYYAVKATDTGQDVSPLSATATAATPAAPAAPVNVAPTANSSTKVTVIWSETVPTNGLPIKYYYVFRGTTPTSLSKVGTVVSATYTDNGVTGGNTYYYAVEAIDNDLDTSPMSTPPAPVTTP